MKNKNLIIKNASEIVTCSGFNAKKGKEMSELHIITDGAVVIEDGIIKAVGKNDEILKNLDLSKYDTIDAENKTILPGFVDSHTHLVFGGYRADEFNWRQIGRAHV